MGRVERMKRLIKPVRKQKTLEDSQDVKDKGIVKRRCGKGWNGAKRSKRHHAFGDHHKGGTKGGGKTPALMYGDEEMANQNRLLQTNTRNDDGRGQ